MDKVSFILFWFFIWIATSTIVWTFTVLVDIALPEYRVAVWSGFTAFVICNGAACGFALGRSLNK